MVPEKFLLFQLRLVEHIAYSLEDVQFISQEAFEANIDNKLRLLADLIWEDYKDDLLRSSTG